MGAGVAVGADVAAAIAAPLDAGVGDDATALVARAHAVGEEVAEALLDGEGPAPDASAEVAGEPWAATPESAPPAPGDAPALRSGAAVVDPQAATTMAIDATIASGRASGSFMTDPPPSVSPGTGDPVYPRHRVRRGARQKRSVAWRHPHAEVLERAHRERTNRAVGPAPAPVTCGRAAAEAAALPRRTGRRAGPT